MNTRTGAAFLTTSDTYWSVPAFDTAVDFNTDMFFMSHYGRARALLSAQWKALRTVCEQLGTVPRPRKTKESA